MGPLVSVVMICRNGERFLAEALDSVVGQSVTDWELVFVDDGSTDGSLALAGNYAKRDPERIRLVVHSGASWKGTAASRNLGLLAARGQYVAFLDADDVYEPERLARHLRHLEANQGLGVVISQDLYWRSWARAGRRHLDTVIGPAVTPGRPIPPPGLLVGTLLTPGAPLPGLCSVTFRRRVLGHGIPAVFDGHYEDQVLLAAALMRASSLVLDEVLCRYRQHPWSLTRGNDARAHGPGSPARQARGRFLAWLRREVALLPERLPELDAWIDLEMGLLEKTPAPQRRWPAVGSIFEPVSKARAAWKQRRRRRKVMAHVSRLADIYPGASARAYWDHRVQDLVLSGEPPGTRGFIAVHDAYRHRKATYLTGLLRYESWRDRSVLDLGCGIGLDLIRFARAGAHVSGIDLSATAIKLASMNLAAAGHTASLLQGDAASLPFKNQSFDLVVAYALLSFVQDPRAVAAEILRVLKPGGTAVLMAYNRRSWMWLLSLPFGGPGGHADAPFYRTETPDSWLQVCEAFPAAQTWTDRFPAGVPGGRTGATALAAVWHRLPPRLTRNLGWHLLAIAKKAG